MWTSEKSVLLHPETQHVVVPRSSKMRSNTVTALTLVWSSLLSHYSRARTCSECRRRNPPPQVLYVPTRALCASCDNTPNTDCKFCRLPRLQQSCSTKRERPRSHENPNTEDGRSWWRRGCHDALEAPRAPGARQEAHDHECTLLWLPRPLRGRHARGASPQPNPEIHSNCPVSSLTRLPTPAVLRRSCLTLFTLLLCSQPALCPVSLA